MKLKLLLTGSNSLSPTLLLTLSKKQIKSTHDEQDGEGVCREWKDCVIAKLGDEVL
jgi:hypothetical protein